MTDDSHRYYCAYCRRFVFGDAPGQLAMRVNSHNSSHHPADFANWTDLGIVMSAQYMGPISAPLVKYTLPFGTTSRSGVTPAKVYDITDEDRKFLKQALVLW